jgi:hypothetical protein
MGHGSLLLLFASAAAPSPASGTGALLGWTALVVRGLLGVRVVLGTVEAFPVLRVRVTVVVVVVAGATPPAAPALPVSRTVARVALVRPKKEKKNLSGRDVE